jgi:hypothetical protein
MPWAAPPCKAASGPEIEVGVRATLGEFFDKVGSAHELANRAAAILVFPTVVKAGFGIGGEYGEGALHIRGQAVGYRDGGKPWNCGRDRLSRARHAFADEKSLEQKREEDSIIWRIEGLQ